MGSHLAAGMGEAPTSNSSAGQARGQQLKNALQGWLLERAESAADVIRHSFVARVCDFGSSFVTPSADVASGKRMVGHSACGSTKYSSPQVRRLMCLRMDSKNSEMVWPKASWDALRSEGYDPFLGDVWSLGVLLYVCSCGSRPWRYACVFDADWRGFVAHTQPHVLSDSVCAPGSSVWHDTSPSSWKWPSRMSPALKHLLRGCLAVRESERLSMHQVLQHPWFENPRWRPAEDAQAVLAPSPVHREATTAAAGVALLPTIAAAAGASVVATPQAGSTSSFVPLASSPLRVSALPPTHTSLPSGASSGSRLSSAHSSASPASHRSVRSAAGDNRTPTTDALSMESPAVGSLRIPRVQSDSDQSLNSGSPMHSTNGYSYGGVYSGSSLPSGGDRSLNTSSGQQSAHSFRSFLGTEPSPTAVVNEQPQAAALHPRVALGASAAAQAASGSLSAGSASRGQGIAVRTTTGSLQSRTQSSHALSGETPAGGSPHTGTG